MAQDILITPGSGEPQILFRGSGTNDTPIELNVLSSYQSASSSGSALLFEGTEGQLFAITDNLSSGVIFSVAGAAGLPFIEADASGDVRLIEYGRYVGVGTGTPAYQLDVFGTGRFSNGIMFGDGTTQTTAAGGGGTPGGSDTNIQFNNGGSFSGESTLTWNYDTDALTVSGNTLMAGTGVILDVKTTGGTTLFAVEDTTETTLVVNSQDGQTSHPFEVRDAFGITTASIDVSGNISGNHISFSDGTTQTTAAGGGGSTTGTASGVAFFGNDNNLTESTSFTFDSGNKILNVFGTGTEYGTLKLGQNARWVSRNGTAISYQSSATNFPVLFNAHHSVVLASNVDFGWSSNSSDPFGATTDTIVSRDAAGTVGFYKSGGSTYGTINVGNMVIDNPTSSNVNLVVKGAASQSANLQEWQDSSAGVLAHVDNQGMISGTGITYSDGTSQTSLFSTVETNANSGITLSCSDAGKYIRCTHAVSVGITIPSGLSCYDYTEYMFEQAGAGQISVTGNAGVTLNTSSSAKSRTQYSVITIKKVAADTYTVFGDVE